MARQVKTGLDYFPLDCVMDDKIALIEAEFGLQGFAVVVKLYQKIYGERGYYCEWTKEVALLFAHNIGLGGNVVSEIVDAAIRRGVFDSNLFKKYGVLTSKGIQQRYIEATSRRKQVEIYREYLLIEVDFFSKNVSIISLNVNINSENVNINSQSKVKESKVKKSNNYVPPPAKAVDDTEKYFISLPLNDKTIYNVTVADVQHYKELYPAVNIEQELRSMLGWTESSPKNRKTRNGVKAFITNWLNRAQNRGGVGYGAVHGNNPQVRTGGQTSGNFKTGEKIF